MSDGGEVNTGGGAPGRPPHPASPQSGPPGGRLPPRGRPWRWQRVLGWIAAGLAVVLVITSLAAYLKFRSVWDSITRVSVSGLGPQPPELTRAMNVLVIGSDSRAGPNQKFGSAITGQRSDTIIVLHIAPGKHGVIVLSIPRDSVVPILSCPPEQGSAGQAAQPGQVEQINATFANGGPGCLFKTVEQTTQLHLNHFIELDFTGFEQVINDIGGVSICLPFAINDPQSNLSLAPGRHHVYGREALAYWRARYIGEGSDLQRILRDQYLMVSILQGVEHSHLLTSPSRILPVVTDAARSMTTDTGLSLPTMIGMFDNLRGLPPGSVQFIELPTIAYPPNPNWVSWPASDTGLFSAIARDQAVHPTAKEAQRPAAPVALTASAQVSVGVVSGSGTKPAASPAPTSQPGSLTGSNGGITGSTNVCRDSAAFAGPRGGS